MSSMANGFSSRPKEDKNQKENEKPVPVAAVAAAVKPLERDVDAEFEAMLDRRNIPINNRANMRKLDTHLKIELCKQDLEEIAAADRKSVV